MGQGEGRRVGVKLPLFGGGDNILGWGMGFRVSIRKKIVLRRGLAVVFLDFLWVFVSTELTFLWIFYVYV